VRGRSRRVSAGIFRNLPFCESCFSTIAEPPHGFAGFNAEAAFDTRRTRQFFLIWINDILQLKLSIPFGLLRWDRVQCIFRSDKHAHMDSILL